MKRIIKFAAILTVIAVMFSCQKPQPLAAPNPISPSDTLALEDTASSVEFRWNSVEGALNYALEIADNATFFGALVYGDDELFDTTCQVSVDSFTLDSTYYWRVSANDGADWSPWSETIQFTPGEQVLALDLDTTYFPFGLGYEWCYQRHYHGYEFYEPFSKYDTVTISVIDSFWDGDAMKFMLDGGFYDLHNPVRIIGDTIILHMNLWWDYTHPISLVEQPEIDDLLAYQGDIMVITTGDFDGLYSDWTEVKRRKGIGAFFMLSQSTYVDPYAYAYSMDYRLLYFTTPEGQIYP